MLPNRMNQVVQAILAAGIAVTAVFTSIHATNGTFTNAAITAAQITTANMTVASTTGLIVGQGTSMDFIKRNIVSLNPAAIAPGQTTSVSMVLTGVVAGDHCTTVASMGDLSLPTSTARMWTIAGNASGTVYIMNASGTGAVYDAASSTLSTLCFSS